MKHLAKIVMSLFFVFVLYECTNTKNNSYDRILAINREVWDSIGWQDSSSSGIEMPFYKMVESGKPVNFNELLMIYGEEYMETNTWVFNDINDEPTFKSPLGDFAWDWWFGRESLLTKLNDYPITIKRVSWYVDSLRSIFMYYKCEENDSLVPIDGFLFIWMDMPNFNEEP